VVPDPGGAGGHARHAAQAPVEVGERGGGRRTVREDLVHEHDPAPGRVHLLAPQLVGGAGRQAESAVDARVGERPQVRPGRDRSAGSSRAHQMPPTKQPGASRRPGSNCSLTRRMSRSAPGSTGPHTSTAARTCSLACRTTAPPPTAASPSRSPVTNPGTRSGSPPTDTCSTAGPALPRTATGVATAPAARSTAATAPARSAGRHRTSTRVPSGPPGQRPNQAGGRSATSPPTSSAAAAARAATPPPVPSNRAATVTGAPTAGRSTSTALGESWLPSSAAACPCAAGGSGASTLTHAVARGSGCSRSTTRTITPSVPKEPHSSLPRSQPAPLLTTRLPAVASVRPART